MKVLKTEFDGLLIFEPKCYNDSRGAFYESWRLNIYKTSGISENFIQDNVSISKKNVLRGLHGQEEEGQLVSVAFGEVFDVMVDLRKNSKTYKKYFSIILNGEKPKQIYMPAGFLHGFCVLSEIAIINYKCTQYYDSAKEFGIIWDDPIIGIKWPNIKFIVSERDAKFPNLKG